MAILNMDIATYNTIKYLILVDSYSGFIFSEKLPKHKTSKDIVKILRKIFSVHGKPNKLVTDNEPILVSETVKDFCKNKKILLIGSSPNHSVSNHTAEQGVKEFKKLLKTASPDEDILDLILEMNSSPKKTGYIPAELFFQKKTKNRYTRNI